MGWKSAVERLKMAFYSLRRKEGHELFTNVVPNPMLIGHFGART